MAPIARPKGQKPSKVVKPKKSTKHTTASHKNHRFQPFSERIAKLKIDPIRRRRKAEEREGLSGASETHFGKALEEWRDLNLSQTFTSFAKEAAPLCESLPVLLHSEEKMMDVLVAHIEKADSLAMEPLLGLLSSFAHDLDARFEKHFQRAVSTVVSVAAKHPDPAVVEWSFTCLAWLFKYLSRLLVPNLLPLYDLMAPYLGKEPQKPFIIRFAAESMSFLVRKAALSKEENTSPIDRIVGHIFQDCLRAPDLQQQGIMTMLTEAIRGVQGGLHSGALATLQSMLDVATDRLPCPEVQNILKGVLTSIIHHTNAETFRPVQDLILAHISNIRHTAAADRLKFSALLIFTMASVRKGTRISDWKTLVSRLADMVDAGAQHGQVKETKASIMSAVAVTLQSATMDAVLPNLRVLETIWTGEWTTFFPQFCDLFARLGHERFHQFLLPQLQSYMAEHWAHAGDQISSLLPSIAAPTRSVCISCPEGFEERIVKAVTNLTSLFDSPEQRGEAVVDASRSLKALPHLKLRDPARSKLVASLESVLRHALDVKDEELISWKGFAFVSCFASMLELRENYESISDIWPKLCERTHELLGLPMLWPSVHRYLKRSSAVRTDGPHVARLESALLECLSMPSHEIREAALDIIELLYRHRGRQVPVVLSTAVTIESTPISFETSRRISMDIRRLAQAYSDSGLDVFLQKAIPSYCFGLLHVKLTQAWEDATTTLTELCKHPAAEDVVTDLAQRWLDGAVTDPESAETTEERAVLDIESNGFLVTSDFECSNLARMSAICDQVFGAENAGRPSSAQQVQIDRKHIPQVSSTARSQALRVLNKMPQIAEKKSRMLVPILLRWAGPFADAEAAVGDASQRWNRADQKAMLSVFAQFTNPRVLYKQAEVYSALLHLCSNGDLEIQRSALKALCAWKEPAVVRYEDHLFNLLDESRFRDELSIFLQDDSEDDEVRVRPEDQSKLMPVLLRLIYGRAVAGGKQSQGSRRKAIFVALSQRGHDVLETFIGIALGPLAGLGAIERSPLDEQILMLSTIPLRRQLGMVNMFGDMLETLGSCLKAFDAHIMGAALLATTSASRRLNSVEDTNDGSLLRSIRQAGMQCLVHILSDMPDAHSPEVVTLVLQEVVAPRLSNLATEYTQSVSGLLKLISSLCTSAYAAQCLVKEPLLLDKTAELLQEPNAKDEVRIFILQDILDRLLDDRFGDVLTAEHVQRFTASIGQVLNKQPQKGVLDACVSSLTNLAGLIGTKKEAESILDVCADLLTKPGMIVSPATKVGLLRTTVPLLENFDIGASPALYGAVCGLFSRLSGQENRDLLSSVLVKLCRHDTALMKSAEISADMNSVGAGLQEVDHERRERGFAQVTELALDFSTAQWQPIVHNCLFYIRDAEDMVNRSSASQALQSFVTAASQSDMSKSLVADTLLPGIERGLKQESELVRSEYLRLLGHIVASFPEWQAVNDMAVLSVGGDDEASIFSNVLHIQQHRRLRALRRLAEEATSLGSSNTTKFFLPLLEHFVFDQVEGDAGRTLSDQTIQTLGTLAKSLAWPAYRATFKRYIGYLKSKEDHEKAVLRLIGTFVEALSTDAESSEKNAKKAEIITRDFLPPLTDYVHHKDESTIDRRMPVAITIVKLLQCLPDPDMVSRLAPVLSDVCHVLRSRSQEARDQARKTLASVSLLLGPPYFGYILKELRSALQRGYQLHVLSFTVHSLLVNAAEIYEPGDLDYCTPDLVAVIMDDIFGITGQEKDAEEYKSGMKEVKSSKSYDTMELLARIAPVQKLGLLVKPLRDLLSEKLDSKMLKKIDDLLTRLRKGLDQNAAADTRDMLVFCHEIVRQVHAEQQAAANPTEKAADRRKNRYLIQVESAANKLKTKGTTTSQLFKLASFALNLLRKVLRRHEDLMTPGNMAGFLPIAGDALVQGQDDVQVAAMKLLGTVMKLPMPALDNNALVYVSESVRLIKGATSMTTDSAKAALELITSVLREKRSVSIKERDVAEVLKCLKTDIDEPDRQGIIYKFLRAVLGRKIMIKEVYELMDEVGKVVVTNPDRNVRESARSAYFQFVMEYPQGKDRWNKQAAFFVENLKYERSNGRQSVMELLNQLLAKVGDDVFAQLAFTLFVALVPVLANDEDRDCRQMAAILIGRLVERANEEHYELFMKLMEKWLMNDGNQAIVIASLRCWMVILRTRAPEKHRIEALRDRLQLLIANASDEFEHDTDDARTLAALETAEVLMETRPDVAFAPNGQDNDICTPLAKYVMLPSIEAKELAAKLLGAFFSHMASSASKTSDGLAGLPLRGAYGIVVEREALRHMCLCSLAALRKNTEQLNETIAGHNIRNLVFLGRCFAANGLSWKEEAGSDSDTDEDKAIEDDVQQQDPSALAYLLNRLSYIIRQETFPPISRSAAIQAQTALLPHVSDLPNLDAVIRPLYLLTDPTIPQPPGEAHRVLIDHARELLEAVQKKVGSEAYVAALGVARKEVGKRREERRQKRRIEAVSRPEKWAQEKRRKLAAGKERKREKGFEHRGKRRGW